MLKDFYQNRKEREDWAEKINATNDLSANKNVEEKLFKKLRELNIKVKGKRVVQLGCVKGSLMRNFLKRGASVHAVDFSKTSLLQARAYLPIEPNNTPRYQTNSIIRDFSILSDFVFDMVVAVTMLEHLPEDMAERIIEDAKRVLKEKIGVFVFKLPLGKKHESIKSKVHPHLDYNVWTHEELAKLACKYKYHAIDIGEISIFYKGSHQ